jgi:DNA-binding transcriptional regulator YhcF (GntR family)
VDIPLDRTLEVPISTQLVTWVSSAVAIGRLSPGDKLPTVRALAAELGLAPNTVAKAFRELEGSGVVETKGRSGTYIRGAGVAQAARSAAYTYAMTAQGLGLTLAEAQQLIARAW